MRKINWPLVLICTIGILSAIMLVKIWGRDTPARPPSPSTVYPPDPFTPMKSPVVKPPPAPPPIVEPVPPPPVVTEEPPPAATVPPLIERVEQVEEKLERVVEDFKEKAALLDFGEED